MSITGTVNREGSGVEDGLSSSDLMYLWGMSLGFFSASSCTLSTPTKWFPQFGLLKDSPAWFAEEAIPILICHPQQETYENYNAGYENQA